MPGIRRWSRRQILVPSHCNCLDPRMDAERPQYPSDVVADGLDAEVKLVRDLLGRVAVLEQT